jgi:hypothetical protein
MNPKEKAEELVNKFMNYADAVPEDYDWMDPVSHCDKKQFISAKQCAIIAVDEILKEESIGSLLIDWWKEVKHEIENGK